MDDLLKIAGQSSSRSSGSGDSGGGGGGDSRERLQGKDPEESKDRNQKKEQEGKKDPLQDNAKKGDGNPDGGEKNDQVPKKPVEPPKSARQSPKPQDLKGVFLAKLPDKVREAVLNGDFDQVPEKYRELVREWTKALAEKDAEGE